MPTIRKVPPRAAMVATRDELRLESLAKAQRTRVAVGQLRDELARSEITIDEALDDRRAESWTAQYIITAVSGIGRVRARRLLFRAGITLDCRCRNLTNRQREALVDLMSEVSR